MQLLILAVVVVVLDMEVLPDLLVVAVLVLLLSDMPSNQGVI
jgi:hypothetical protein